MKTSCLQENLSTGLAIAARAVASRATLPVLEHILIEAQPEDHRVRLSATDISLGINVYVGAKVEEPGSICIPARTVIDLVKAFPSERVDLEVDQKKQVLTLRCARSEANVKGLDPQEMPIVARPKDGVRVPVPAEDLRLAMKQAGVISEPDVTFHTGGWAKRYS